MKHVTNIVYAFSSLGILIATAYFAPTVFSSMKNIEFVQPVEGTNYTLVALINVFLIMFIIMPIVASLGLLVSMSTERNEIAISKPVKEEGKKPLLKRIFNV